MRINGTSQNIKDEFQRIIQESTPLMLSNNYVTDFEVLHCEPVKYDDYHILISIFFAGKPVYMFGIINLSKNQGSLKIYNYYSFENFLFDMTDMVIKNFRNVSFKYQRKLIFRMGKELYDYLVDFNGKI
ncbi:hypothetical protein ACJS9L_16585 [Bacillus cereus]